LVTPASLPLWLVGVTLLLVLASAKTGTVSRGVGNSGPGWQRRSPSFEALADRSVTVAVVVVKRCALKRVGRTCSALAANESRSCFRVVSVFLGFSIVNARLAAFSSSSWLPQHYLRRPRGAGNAWPVNMHGNECEDTTSSSEQPVLTT